MLVTVQDGSVGAGQHNAVFHAVIRGPKLLLSGVCWFPDLGLLSGSSIFGHRHEKKGEWLGRSVLARTVGILPFHWYSSGHYSVTQQQPNLGYMVSVPRRKREWGWQACSITLARPEHSDYQSCILRVYFQVLRRSLAIEQMQSIVVKSMTSIQIPWIQIPPPSLVRNDKYPSLSRWLGFLIVKWG